MFSSLFFNSEQYTLNVDLDSQRLWALNPIPNRHVMTKIPEPQKKRWVVFFVIYSEAVPLVSLQFPVQIPPDTRLSKQQK